MTGDKYVGYVHRAIVVVAVGNEISRITCISYNATS